MYKLFMQLNSPDMDEYTRFEVRRFIEQRLDEHAKFRGQIARDLRRLGGEDAYRNPRFYHLLKEKYLRAHQSRKKLAILEMEHKNYCE